MNYETYIKHEFTFNYGTLPVNAVSIVCFVSNGETYVIDNYTSSVGSGLLEVTTFICNEFSRNYTGNGRMVACELFSGYTGTSIQFITNYVDYVINGGTYGISAGYYADPESNTNIQYAPSVADYSNYLPINFEEFSYGYYNPQLSDSMSVYDLTSLKSDVDYYNDTFFVRGENYSFYKHALFKGNFQAGPAYFAYGSPLADVREQSRTAGYNDGYSAGYIAGNDNGYQVGISQNGNIGQNTANAFNFIGQGFSAVASVMSIEVLPNITIGLCFSIPLVFVLIMTIFKLVRK